MTRRSPASVAIFFWEGHLSVAPSLLGAIQTLAGKGFEVDVFVRGMGERAASLGTLPPGVRIIDNHAARWFSSAPVKRLLPARASVGLGVLSYLASSWREVQRRPYVAVFGVDSIGAFCARLIASRRNIPFFFWSLELTFLKEAEGLHSRILKWMERRACHGSSWIIIQDEQRAAALLEENRPGHRRVLLVPNAPAGPENRNRTEYLAEKLRIPKELKIVLHAGVLEDYVLPFELAESVADWPAQYCLVLHASVGKSEDDPLVRRIRALKNPRVFLSLDPVPASELDLLISSAYIGLATYGENLGTNCELIVNASGKLATYLRNGLPLICTNQPGMAELVETYHCGFSLRRLSELPGALAGISRDYPAFRAGAFEAYLGRYEFSSHFSKVVDLLGPVIT